MTPARDVDITCWNNGFYSESFTFDDGAAPIDLTGYAGKLQVRLYGAQPGAAVISLASVTSAVEGVWIAEPAQGVVEVRIEEATLASAYAALSAGLEAGAALMLAYDLVLTNPAGDDEVWATGEFIINAGVTP